ncbi:MAG: energy transducer TonB [Acidobacteria bacterium]|nr:energy transducer TonB [Acidobacteriota bacterium]
MELDQVIRNYQSLDREAVGMKAAIVLSIGLHVMVLAALVFFGLHQPKREPLPSVTVGISTKLPTKAAGKERKAAVSRTSENTSKPKPKPKKETPKPETKQVALGDKVKKQPSKESSAPEVKPDLNPPKDEKKPRDSGGTGGTAENGATLDMSALGDPNAPITEFSDYYATIVGEISNHWLRGSFSGNVVTVSFNITRDGSVEDAFIAESSGQSFLDSPALRAVLASRFPPLPQGYREEKMRINMRFRYDM